MVNGSVWLQISAILKDLLPPEASIAIADDKKFIDYLPGAYDIHIEPGKEIPSESISARVVSHRANIESLMDASLFGSPYFGKGYPFFLEQSWGAVTVIYPPEQTRREPPSGLLATTANLDILSFVTGQKGELWRPVPVNEIAFLESLSKKTWLHTKDEVYSTNLTMQTLERQLPPSFLRIHRSYIVNIAMIDHIRRDLSTPFILTLRPPFTKQLPVSQSYAKQLRIRLGF